MSITALSKFQLAALLVLALATILIVTFFTLTFVAHVDVWHIFTPGTGLVYPRG